MKKKIALSLLVVGTLLIAGCSAEPPETADYNSTENGSGVSAVEDADEGRTVDEIRAYYDEDGEVVCFTYRDNNNGASTGGMDCLPINDTAYNESDFQ